MPKEAPSDIEFRASYYQEFLAERQKIIDHKWNASEQAQHDIGWETALVGWVNNHRSNWKKSRTRRSD